MLNVINHILDILNNYFEEILLLNAFCLVLGLVLILASKSETFNKNVVLNALNSVLYRLLIIGEVCLLVLTGYVYWLNYMTKPLLPLEERVVYRTDWVKDDLEIFFIAGNSLSSIKANGVGRKTIVNAPGPIREYHFSPDGRHIAVVTDSQLYLISRSENVPELVEDIKTDTVDEGGGFVIRAVSWAPDSKKFCYQKSMWSRYANQEQFLIYDIKSREKVSLKTTGRQVPFLFWDKNSDALYFFQHQAQDTSRTQNKFWVKVFKIPLDTREPVFVRQRPADSYELDMTYFTSFGADIFYEGFRLSYDRIEDDSFWASIEGPRLGVDNEDYLYYLKGRWWRKRLFKVPREELKGPIPRYQYKGGTIALRHVRWLPGARYVVMEHGTFGILIMEPSSGKVGQLTYAPGHTFGWYRPIDRHDADFSSALERLNLKSVGGK